MFLLILPSPHLVASLCFVYVQSCDHTDNIYVAIFNPCRKAQTEDLLQSFDKYVHPFSFPPPILCVSAGKGLHTTQSCQQTLNRLIVPYYVSVSQEHAWRDSELGFSTLVHSVANSWGRLIWPQSCQQTLNGLIVPYHKSRIVSYGFSTLVHSLEAVANSWDQLIWSRVCYVIMCSFEVYTWQFNFIINKCVLWWRRNS